MRCFFPSSLGTLSLLPRLEAPCIPCYVLLVDGASSKVEASPRTCATLRRRVTELHSDHRIRSVNVAVAPFSGEASFYVVSERFQQDKGAVV